MLAVTPHVSRDGEIILNVRPTITRVNRFVNDPQPDLANAKVTNPVPELLVREMESILRLDSGQVAVLGGLMQDNHEIDTDGVRCSRSWTGSAACSGSQGQLRQDRAGDLHPPAGHPHPERRRGLSGVPHYLPGSDDAAAADSFRRPPPAVRHGLRAGDVVQFRPAVPVAGPPGPVSGSLAGTGGAGGDPSGATGVAGSRLPQPAPPAIRPGRLAPPPVRLARPIPPPVGWHGRRCRRSVRDDWLRRRSGWRDRYRWRSGWHGRRCRGRFDRRRRRHGLSCRRFRECGFPIDPRSRYRDQEAPARRSGPGRRSHGPTRRSTRATPIRPRRCTGACSIAYPATRRPPRSRGRSRRGRSDGRRQPPAMPGSSRSTPPTASHGPPSSPSGSRIRCAGRAA